MSSSSWILDRWELKNTDAMRSVFSPRIDSEDYPSVPVLEFFISVASGVLNSIGPILEYSIAWHKIEFVLCECLDAETELFARALPARWCLDAWGSCSLRRTGNLDQEC